jgi:uncharacterized protein with LGFP repeats
MNTKMARAAAVAGGLAVTAAFAVSCSQAQEVGSNIASNASEVGGSAASVASSAAGAAGSAAFSAAGAAGSVASSAAGAAGSAASSAGSVASSAVSSVLNAAPTTLNVPGLGDVSLDGPTAEAYQKAGGEAKLGVPTAAVETVGDGTVATFTNGTIFSSPSTGAHLVQGEILRVYTEAGGPAGPLGFPTSSEAQTGGGPRTTGGGWISEFQNGTITWTNAGGGTFIETVSEG